MQRQNFSPRFDALAASEELVASLCIALKGPSPKDDTAGSILFSSPTDHSGAVIMSARAFSSLGACLTSDFPKLACFGDVQWCCLGSASMVPTGCDASPVQYPPCSQRAQGQVGLTRLLLFLSSQVEAHSGPSSLPSPKRLCLGQSCPRSFLLRPQATWPVSFCDWHGDRHHVRLVNDVSVFFFPQTMLSVSSRENRKSISLALK